MMTFKHHVHITVLLEKHPYEQLCEQLGRGTIIYLPRQPIPIPNDEKKKLNYVEKLNEID